MWKSLTNVAGRKRLVVKRYHPFYSLIGWAGICMLFSMVIYLLCLSELKTLQSGYFPVSTDKQQLQALNVRLTSQNELLRERVVILERAAQVDHVAYKEVSETVEFLQDEIREAKEELIFYRGLFASSDQDQEKGLLIQSFVLRPGDADHSYHYRLVLTRFQKDDKVVKGVVDLSVVGQQEGKPSRLELPEITSEDPRKLAFRFKNFQKMEGYLMLPTGFTPHQMVITVILKGAKPQRITKTIDWSSMMN